MMSQKEFLGDIKKYSLSGENNFKFEANNETQKVFSKEQEEELLLYIIRAAQWNFGVTVEEMKRLASMLNLITVNIQRNGRNARQLAGSGIECFERHKQRISLRKPEATRLGRMALNLAKNNGNIFLTFPPHASHKLQPLDRTVFGPFKSYYSKSAKEWMLNHLGKPISIYDVSTLLGKAFPLAFTPTNITAGFSVTGIWPINANIFGDYEFLPAEMTNRPYVDTSPVIELPNISEQTVHEESREETISTNGLQKLHVTPAEIRPFPKTPPRKSSCKGRKPGKCMIATDTPKKKEIEERKIKRTPKVQTVKQVVMSSSSDDEELESPSSSSRENIDSASDKEDFTIFFDANEKQVFSEGSWVLMRFVVNGKSIHYIGIVILCTEDDVMVKFLRKNTSYFVFPNVDDISSVTRQNITKVLPSPFIRRGMHNFNIKFPPDVVLK